MPILNSDELFQSKVMCENLVLIGWAFQELLCPQTKKKKMNSLGDRNPLLEGGFRFDTWCPFLNLDEPFQSKVMCENLVWIGSNRRYVKFQGEWGQNPPIRGNHMWAAMLIFVHGRAISVKSLVWKFGLDWLSLSRVIVVTDKKKIEFSKGQKSPIRGGRGYIWPLMPIFKLGWTIPVKSHVWKFDLDWLKSEVCKISDGGVEGKSPLLRGSHVPGDAHFCTWPSYFS